MIVVSAGPGRLGRVSLPPRVQHTRRSLRMASATGSRPSYERSTLPYDICVRPLCWLITVLALSVGVVAASSPYAAAIDDPSIQVQLVSSPEAVGLLNEARTANGIPGDLVEEPGLAQGCSEYLNDYEPALGQYPHEERESQPGYTPNGAAAVSMSDLAGRPWGFSGGLKSGLPWWTSRFNPWSDAPLHLTDLFDPAATTAWYAEDHNGACMGSFPFQRGFSTPAFYSYPGNGINDVPTAQTADEAPWTPQQAAGIPGGQTTGPNFILFEEGLEQPVLGSVELQTASGAAVSVAVANPASEEPTPAAGFPTGYTVGEYSRGAGFAIPPAPLPPDTTFVLTAHWEDGATGTPYLQAVTFTTGSETLEQMLPQLPAGQPLDYIPPVEHFTETNDSPVRVTRYAHITMSLRHGRATFTVPAVAAQRTARIVLDTQRLACRGVRTRCRWQTTRVIRHTVRLTAPHTTLSLPRVRHSERLKVIFTLNAFTDDGVQYMPTSAVATIR
jgi:hypothetical protein